jgi:hypothetical protein
LGSLLVLSGIGLFFYSFLGVLAPSGLSRFTIDEWSALFFHLFLSGILLIAGTILWTSRERQSLAILGNEISRMRTPPSMPIRPRIPETAVVLGGVCIGAGLAYAGRYKTGAASAALAILLLWMFLSMHILWSLFLLSVLWYWQMWYGYAEVENFNEELGIMLELER